MSIHFEGNPIAISFGIITIYWYAIAYFLGFGFAYFIAYIKRHSLQLSHHTLQDWLNVSIFGVIIGGRLGYVLLYHFDYYLKNPIKIFFIWEGGMAFHGALIGLAISTYFYFKIKKLDVWKAFDILSLAVTPGLFFGRIGNFINSELIGRPTDSNWGVVFTKVDGITRHPSPLYEATFEGLFVGIFLWVMLKVFKPKAGLLASFFLILYGLGRFFIEFYREPDPQLGLLLFDLSLGQYLSLSMVVVGFICMYIRQKSTPNKGRYHAKLLY